MRIEPLFSDCAGALLSLPLDPSIGTCKTLSRVLPPPSIPRKFLHIEMLTPEYASLHFRDR